MSLENLKLTYFDARGRAEVIRLLLALADKKYEDIRLTHEAWAAEKPNTPFGQLPVLEIDGERYGQSVALANYVARAAGLYAKSDIECLKIDQTVQRTLDFWSLGVKTFFEKDEAKKAELLKHLTEVDAPVYLDSFEKLLKKSGTGYFVGKSITLADVFVYDIIYNFTLRKILSTDGYPLLHDLIKKVESNDKIKAYLSTRKQTEN